MKYFLTFFIGLCQGKLYKSFVTLNISFALKKLGARILSSFHFPLLDIGGESSKHGQIWCAVFIMTDSEFGETSCVSMNGISKIVLIILTS